MRRITPLKSVGCSDIFFPYDHEYIFLISVYEYLHLSCTNNCCVYPHVVGYNNIFHSPFSKVIFVLKTKEDTMPHISSDTTSKLNSSINFEAIENLTLHFLVTLSFYPTKRIRLWMWFSFKTHLFDKCFVYQV
jgi:hypothetical protein